jgi:HAE1 family hydrophobic/amphiphilic exporter-1
MQWLAALCVRRPVFASVLILSLTVIGTFSFTRLGIDQFPNVDIPTILVTTRLPGAAPEQVESEVTDKIEEAVNTISGIDTLTSTSSEGVSLVVVGFTLEKDADVATQEVRDKIDRVLPLLPRTITQPTVERRDPDAFPVLTVALTADEPLRDITEYADKILRRRLESSEGVGQVLVLGGRRRQINVWLDAEQMLAQGLTVNDVSRALQAQNSDVPGGRIEQGAQALTLRTRGRVESADAFGDVVVRNVQGHPVLVRDIARVEDGMADVGTLASVNGDPTVLLQIRKQSGTNTVAIVNGVKERLTELEPTLPPGYRIRIVRDQAEFIEASIESVESHLIIGSILASLVVLLFLGHVRSTIIAAISIPTSIVATFGLVHYMGFTLNMLTMLALTLAVGIVIDDAIVVLENIFRFIEEKGMPPARAAVEATEEIGLAVLATTLSLAAIFVPVAFMSGMVGRFMQSFGLTMAFAIMVSMLVSFTLTPMMCAHWLKPRRAAGPGGEVPGHASKDSRIFAALDRTYARMLEWSMTHRGLVAALAVLVLLSSVPLFQTVDVNFMPRDDQSGFDVAVRAPEGTSLEATELMATRLTAAIQRLPEVDYTLVTVAGDGAGTQNSASIFVKLTPIEARRRDQFEVMAAIRDDIVAPLVAQGVRASVGGGGFGGGGIQYVLQGPEIAELQQYSERLLARVKTIPGVVDADTTLNVGKPELSVRMDRPKAADLGVPLAEAADALRLLVGGDAVTTYNEGGEQYEVHVRAQLNDRDSAAAIGRLPVPSRLGPIALENVASFATSEAPSDIRRLSRQRQVTVIVNLLPGASQRAVQDDIALAGEELGLGADYRGEFSGQSRELNRTASAFLTAFALSMIFMYLVLAAQFESWLHPVTILLSLPLTLPFALLSLIIFQQSLNVFSALGLLVLFGVVKKNSILQIDRANQLKDAGLSTHDAIVQACRDRLRPILMTTLAFVAGMVPLVVTRGAGAGTNHAIGWVVIGGQTLVLALTLVVTPVTYALFDDLRRKQLAGRAARWVTSRLRAAQPVTPA